MTFSLLCGKESQQRKNESVAKKSERKKEKMTKPTKAGKERENRKRKRNGDEASREAEEKIIKVMKKILMKSDL